MGVFAERHDDILLSEIVMDGFPLLSLLAKRVLRMEHISSRFNGNLTKEWRTHLHAQNSGHSVEILSLGKFTIFQQNFLVIKNENFTLTKEIIRQINLTL